MNEKIYISPSSQPENKYAVGNTNEQEQCRKIARALEKKLDNYGFDAKAGLSGTMYTRVTASNKMGAKLHLPIHTNAHNGKTAGLRIFVAKMGGEAEKIAKAITKELAPITPGKSDNISVANLYEINNTNAICVYIEVGFHDNKEEAQWIIDHTDAIANAIATALCKHYKVNQEVAKPETAKPTETKRVHTVKKGDSLWSIAKKYLGNGGRYPEIVKLNGLKSTVIRVGQKLTIPNK